jgi:hypothetical protein
MRKKAARFLRSKPIDASLIFLIVVYTILVFVFFGLEDFYKDEKDIVFSL